MIPVLVLTHKFPLESFNAALAEMGELYSNTDMDLSGNAIDAAVYYVAKGNPIIAKTGNGVYELVYRYDSKNVYTYDLTSHKEKTYSKVKFDQLIAGYGSVLIIY